MIRITVLIKDIVGTDEWEIRRTMNATGMGATMDEVAVGNMFMDVLQALSEPEKGSQDIKELLIKIFSNTKKHNET